MIKLTVVIVAHNEEKLLPVCLEAVLKSYYYSQDKILKVFVVDNASRDKTVDIIRDFESRFPDVFSYVFESKIGIGYARAAGASAVSNFLKNRGVNKKYVWNITTDADVIVPENWFSAWHREVLNHQADIITGNASFSDQLKSWPYSMEVFKENDRFINSIERIVGVINADGFNTAINQHAYDVIGPYQQFFTEDNGVQKTAPGEDWDLSYRAFRKGMQVIRTFKTEISISPRRYIDGPISYLTGEAYEEEHTRIDSDKRLGIHEDPCADKVEYFSDLFKKRNFGYYFVKSLIAKPNLLDELTNKILNNQNNNLLSFLSDSLKSNLDKNELKLGVDDYLKAVRIEKKICDDITIEMMHDLEQLTSGSLSD